MGHVSLSYRNRQPQILARNSRDSSPLAEVAGSKSGNNRKIAVRRNVMLKLLSISD